MFVVCLVLQIPKPGGIRKGWMKEFVVVCDFKLFLYDIFPDRVNPVSNVVSQVIDMRLEHCCFYTDSSL